MTNSCALNNEVIKFFTLSSKNELQLEHQLVNQNGVNAAVLGDGGALRLTTPEASLLRILAENAGRVLSRDALTQLCAIDGTDRMIDVQVTRLRRKIEPDTKAPRYLQTVRGQGYVLRPD